MRATFQSKVTGQVEGSGREFDVLLITAGEGNGWVFPAEVLAASVPLWDGVTSFVDHYGGDDLFRGTRSVRDVAGVIHSTRWDAESQGVRGRLRLSGGNHVVLVDMFRQVLTDRAAGVAVPDVGLSADVGFEAARGSNIVGSIVKVFSVDVVYGPARGGKLLAALAKKIYEQPILNELGGMEMEDKVKYEVNNVEKEADPAANDSDVPARWQPGAALEQTQAAQAAGGGNGAGGGFQPDGAAASEVSGLRGLLVETLLSSSGLPEPFRGAAREELQDIGPGAILSVERVKAVVDRYRRLAASQVENQVVKGVGRTVVQGMRTDMDRLQLAVDRLFGLELPESAGDVPRLSGIRELYLLTTGDHDFHGRFNRSRVQFANATTTTMAELVRNVMNKVVVQQWERLGRAGYLWWQPIVHEEDFDSLQQVSWVVVGGFADLSTVSEGGAYTELVWDDTRETTDWVKNGNYIGLTLEMIDRDETRKARRVPYLLATAAIRTLSGTIAALFTQASGTGPTLSDSVVLFHAASHANLLTTALGAAGWDAVIQAMFKQTEVNSAKRMGIRPRYLLVPIELEKTAMQLVGTSVEPASNAFYENVRQGSGQVVVVPEWTDATDWAAVADPLIAPGIGVGYRYGRRPEIFIADDEQVGSMFTNDEMRLKVRWFTAVGIINYRALHKNNVA